MFKKLSNLLQERAEDKAVLREVSIVQKTREIWEEQGIFLFPENVRAHILETVKILRVQKDKIIIEAKDPHTKNALMLRQKELLKLLRKDDEKIQTIHLIFPQ